MLTKVSIVEDDRKAREIFMDWVNHADGFRCVSDHGSAEDALEAIPKAAPEVVFMDINLPGLNGVECVRRLKPALPDTQFVMLTVYEDSDHIFQALQAGATGYLLKRTPRTELVAALRDVKAGGSPMTTNIARKVVKAFHKIGTPQTTVEELSARESEVLQLLAQGFLYKEIADALNVAVPTVNTYIRRIYEKLHVRSRTEAVARFAHLPVRGEVAFKP
ncbi:MAG TPA: response regulator transcription factor [Verrucomicrobiota bacterium]|nr:response regulator transcription factor [Verrucomicrobiota bacterium]